MMTRKILLVHPVAETRRLLIQALQDPLWQILQAATEVDAIETAKRQSPDVMVMVGALAAFSSDEVARILKSDPLTCMIPLISIGQPVQTAHMAEPWALDVIELYMQPPILQAKVQNALRLRMRRPYVLVVDDEPDLVEVLSATLSQEGYIVSGASNGLEALSVIDAVHPDVIVLDMAMPYLNGWDCLNQIRSNPHLQDTRIIILTGADKSFHARQQGLKLGAIKYLLKPCDPEDLIQAVRQALSARPRPPQPPAGEH